MRMMTAQMTKLRTFIILLIMAMRKEGAQGANGKGNRRCGTLKRRQLLLRLRRGLIQICQALQKL
jgi:hypothetical protein